MRNKISNSISKIVVLLILFSILGGCASSKKKAEEKEEGPITVSKRKPQWVDSPGKGCINIKELCAVGTGDGPMGAQANARDALAKIFETKVKSETTHYKTMQQSGSGEIPDEVHLDEGAYKQVREMTDQVLEGVEIREQYSDTDYSYALAVLDKRKAAVRLSGQMKELDEKLISLRDDKSLMSFKRMLRFYNMRETINLRYQLLTGKFYPRKMTYGEVLKKRYSSGKAPIVKLALNKNETLENLAQFISGLLNENGVKVLSKNNENLTPQYVLEGNLTHEEVFLNVKGFRRFKFNLSLTFKNAKGVKVQTLEKERIENGRSYTQALEKAITGFRSYLTEELEQLSL